MEEKNKTQNLLSFANRGLLKVCWIVAILVDITIISEFAKGGRTLWETILFMIIVQGTIISAHILMKNNPTNTISRTIIFIGFITAWSMIYITSLHLVTFAFAFPFILMYSLYADKKYVIKISIVVFAIVVIKIVREVILGNTSSLLVTDYTVVIMLSLLFIFAMIENTNTTAMLRQNNENVINEINSSKKENEEMLQDILSISKIIEDNSNSVYKIVNDISESSNILSMSLKQISNGAEDNTNTIQEQVIACNNIQDKINNTSKLSEDVNIISSKNTSIVAKGNDIVSQLYDKSKMVEDNNLEVHNLINELKEKTNNIVSITEVINNIARQTNLLSLNAKIESARLGEQGKGFDVVTEEIRKLADQSKNSIDDISKIIAELQNQLNLSINSIEKLNKANIEQNNLVNETAKIFSIIDNNSTKIQTKVVVINSEINDILNSNDKIVNSINSISSVAEETMAMTEESNAIADNFIEQSIQAKQISTELKLATDKINKYL